MFSEPLNFADSMQVTVLGMGVVFLVLLMLMYIIKVMEKVIYKTPAKSAAPVKGTAPVQPVASSKAVSTAPGAASATVSVTGSDLELVAVIAAAAAASMGVSPSDLVIRGIVRLPETAPLWSLSGRSELMASRGMKH